MQHVGLAELTAPLLGALDVGTLDISGPYFLLFAWVSDMKAVWRLFADKSFNHYLRQAEEFNVEDCRNQRPRTPVTSYDEDYGSPLERSKAIQFKFVTHRSPSPAFWSWKSRAVMTMSPLGDERQVWSCAHPVRDELENQLLTQGSRCHLTKWHAGARKPKRLGFHFNLSRRNWESSNSLQKLRYAARWFQIVLIFNPAWMMVPIHP